MPFDGQNYNQQPDLLGRLMLRAADLIEQYGLRKYDLGNFERGFCTHGALFQAMRERNLLDRSTGYETALSKNMARRLGVPFYHIGNPNACTWNNRPQRTKEEVVARLREKAFCRAEVEV